MTEQKQIDPITLTVIWNTMLSIADELGTILRHTAFSEGVREGDVKHALNYFPAESLKPGDSILLNDSFMGSGHFPDTFQIMPVFVETQLVGFVACSAHQVDMGGAAPGSQKVHGFKTIACSFGARR